MPLLCMNIPLQPITKLSMLLGLPHVCTWKARSAGDQPCYLLFHSFAVYFGELIDTRTKKKLNVQKIATVHSYSLPKSWIVTSENGSGKRTSLRQAVTASSGRKTAQAKLPPLAIHSVDSRCPYGFNVYVYELQGESTGQAFLQYILKHRGPFCQDDCSDAQFALEVHFWRYLLKSPCRTLDPEQAHLFYIPYQETLQFLSVQRPKEHFDVMYKALAEQNYKRLEDVHGMPKKYLARHNGLDHFMTLATPPFGEHVLTSTLPRLDFSLITLLIPEIHKTLLEHKQAIGAENVVVVPYPVFNEPWLPLRETKPPQNRRYLASGLYGLHGDGERIRRLLIDSANSLTQSRKFVGRLLFGEYKPVELRSAKFKGQTGSEVMFETTFCLTPAGDSLSTRRLFNAMLAGCIPVLLGDDLVLPFHRSNIIYEDFLLRVPLSDTSTLEDGQRLFDLLFDIVSSGKAHKMQQSLFQNVPQLIFTLPFDEVPSFPLDERREDMDTGQDAFDALMRELYVRAQEIEDQKRRSVH